MSITLNPLSKPINASMSVPGSKSYANRALIIASLTNTPVKLTNLPANDDVIAMINALKKLGIQIENQDHSVIVQNSITDLEPQKVSIDANQSATTIRFLTALCCLIKGEQKLTGHNSLLSRPIDPLIDSLRSLGAEITRNQDGEVIVSSGELHGENVELDSGLSSQFLTSLLLIAPVMGLTIKTTALATAGYIEITKDILNTFGVAMNTENSQISVQRQSYSCNEYTIEPDVSSASYFWAMAALTGSTITVEGVTSTTKQGDFQITKILEKMGARVVVDGTSTTVTGGELNPVDLDMSQCPDQIQTIAVLTAFAEGKTIISGVETLRLKETDRLAAVTKELAKMNIKTEVQGNTLVLHGGNPKAAQIDTYEDHRMAMSFAVAGTKLTGIEINNPEVTRKTFPNFWDKLKEIGVELS